MGMIRTLVALNGLDDNYKTELFSPIIKKIEELSGKKYDFEKGELGHDEKPDCWDEDVRSMRIIADHLKAAVFFAADGIEPSNEDQGYVMRKVIRRAVRKGHTLGIEKNFVGEISEAVQKIYGDAYPEVLKNEVLDELVREELKFRKTLEKGEARIVKMEGSDVTGEAAFELFQTYGYPIEMVEEIAKEKGLKIAPNFSEEFKEKFKKHQELSRTASAGMFKGGLADTKEKTKQLHTATHLMLAGLRRVLGDHVHQKGSNINGERARFDFSHGEKMTDEQKKQVEDYVNEAIEAKVDVENEEMSLDEAKERGAEGAFENKYGDKVKVYSIEGYSNEICGGPHVKNTGEIEGRFRITKEKSSSSGVRRIKAILE